MEIISTQELQYISGGLECPESIGVWAAAGAGLAMLCGCRFCLASKFIGCCMMTVGAAAMGVIMALMATEACYREKGSF